jgi:dihydroorotate dehydrogenase
MLEARKNTWMMPKVPLIANLCNSAITPENERCSEYTTLMRNLAPYASWFEINISCPNQCGVWEIQKEESKLYELLSDVVKTRNSLMTDNKKHLIFVKVAPNLDEQAISIIAWVCNNVWIDGITATNTSTNHNYRGKDWKWLIEKPDWSIILGWMSGKPLHQESLRTIREFRKKLYSTIPIIWCGGIWYSPLSDVIDTKKVWACGMEILSSIIQWPYGLWTIRAIKQNLKWADINWLLNP